MTNKTNKFIKKYSKKEKIQYYQDLCDKFFVKLLNEGKIDIDTALTECLHMKHICDWQDLRLVKQVYFSKLDQYQSRLNK